jgi:hypothetical protein
MMPSRVLIASGVFVFYFSHSCKPCPMGLGAITHIVKVLLWEQEHNVTILSLEELC